MDLPTIWFCIIAYLFCGFFFLEGFDYGVGILLPFLSRTDDARRMTLATIGGVWDGNEVWMVVAGACIFAAFPNWYATMFSGFYLPLVILVLALIARGVGIKFRSKKEDPVWRNFWDWMVFIGSLVPALLWGIVIGNLLRGVPVDAQMNYVGGFWNLLNPFALVSGLALVLLFTLHGAIYLSLKATGEVLRKVQGLLYPLYVPAFIMATAFLVYGVIEVGLIETLKVRVAAGGAVLALLACGALLKRSVLAAFFASGLTIILVTVGVFMYMYPRVFISSLDPAWSLTIRNASSSTYSLQVMSLIALVFIPTILLYQGWTYWVLRKRIDKHDLGHA